MGLCILFKAYLVLAVHYFLPVHPRAEIQPLFHHNLGVPRCFSRGVDFLDTDIQITAGGFPHLIVYRVLIVFAHLSGDRDGLQPLLGDLPCPEKMPEPQFCHRMSRRSFLRITGGLIGDSRFQLRRWRTMQPSVGAGSTTHCMYFRQLCHLQ